MHTRNQSLSPQFLRALCVLCVLCGYPAMLRAAAAPAAILQQLKSFNTWGSILHIAAHPDDENTRLIAYLARGRNYRAAYLSLTRGDGGQNVLGPEFGDLLGVIRTQELLAARRIDGGRQFFSRARDFGYSKDYQQTLNKWDHQQVLSDIVRIIRYFRPDVLVARFSTIPGNTHGHHTASAILAQEAFKLAGDPKAFPEQLDMLTVWQPKRIFMNNGFGQRGGGGNNATIIRMDVSGIDPVSGQTFSSLAVLSRSQHKTQGFGNLVGYNGNSNGPVIESFTLLAGDPATNDIMDGIDTTWNRVPGGADVGKLTDAAIAAFNPSDLSASVPALLDIRKLTAALKSDPILDEKLQQLDRIIADCAGIDFRTTVASAEVVPGETFTMQHTATVNSAVPVKWIAVRYLASGKQIAEAVPLTQNQPAVRKEQQTLPADTLLTQPYWLREDETPGMFRVDDPSMIVLPENPPAFPIDEVFEIGGQNITLRDQPVMVTTDSKGIEKSQKLDVIPPVSLHLGSDVQLFAPHSSRPIRVEATAFRDDVQGTIQLECPAGWTVSPSSQPLHLAAVGDRAPFTFTVTAPADIGNANILASVTINGTRYSNERIDIRYDHIPPQLLQPAAKVKAVCLDLAIRGHEIAYLPGAGDSTVAALQQMGYSVTSITGADLTPEKLKSFDAVVIGVRAFNVRTNLADHVAGLFQYVQDGGTVVEQYNGPTDLKTPDLAPYALSLQNNLPANRVTDERAPVTFLMPDHPALNTPNKITPADFDGWVQERGLNFPHQWDTDHFDALIACSDVGEAPLKSGILVAKYGKGYFTYTGLSFFRQLPAGVPGAYRLFANLISLGKS